MFCQRGKERREVGGADGRQAGPSSVLPFYEPLVNFVAVFIIDLNLLLSREPVRDLYSIGKVVVFSLWVTDIHRFLIGDATSMFVRRGLVRVTGFGREGQGGAGGVN